MIKQAPLILSVVGASALAVFSMTGPVQAKDAGDWTCSDFLNSQLPQNRVLFTIW